MQPITQHHKISFTAYTIVFDIEYSQDLGNKFRSCRMELIYELEDKTFNIKQQSPCDYDLLLMAQDLIKDLMSEIVFSGIERKDRITFVENFPNKFPNFKR
jgi:hypothetical protein